MPMVNETTAAPDVLERSQEPPLDVTGPILLFDGVCNFCHGSVRFVLDHDPRAQFRFAPIQSAVGQAYLRHFGLAGDALGSMVLIEDGRAHRGSTAGLRTVRRLSAPWGLAYIFIVVPRPMRDVVYRFIVRHRYQWFGKRDTCGIPDTPWRDRFLDEPADTPPAA